MRPDDEPNSRRRVGVLVCCLVAAAGLFTGCASGAETTSETTFPEAIPAKAVGGTASGNGSESATTATSTTESTISPSSTASTTSTVSTTSAPTTAAPTTTAVPTTTVAPVTTVAPTTTQATAIDAATAYLRRCGGCHGAEGTAQGAQTLAGVGSLPESYVLETVMTGGGGMPSFGEWLEQDEIDAIVAYVRASF